VELAMTASNTLFSKSKSFAVSLTVVIVISFPLSLPKPVHAGDRGYVAGALIGGIAAAIIAAEAAKAARQPAGHPKSKNTRSRKQKSPENSNATAENKSSDPFAGVMPTRIRPVRED
jgi:hypothetical protein